MTTGALTSAVAALAASVCFGAAAVLQGMAARRMQRSHIDVRLPLRLARSLPYLSGLAMDLLGFLLALIAMRRLPVFAVEALISSYVAVTAVLAVRLCGTTLRRREWLAVGGVAAGVIMVALSAQVQPTDQVGILARLFLPTATLTLGGLALVVDRVMTRSAPVLAFIGGVAWGLIPLATQMMRDPDSVLGLLSDPAAYTVPAAGGLGLVLYTGALQRTSVVRATAMAILGETLLPAAVGLSLLGDQPRPGTGLVALAGFLLSVGGGLVLARYGDIAPPDAVAADADERSGTSPTTRRAGPPTVCPPRAVDDRHEQARFLVIKIGYEDAVVDDFAGTRRSAAAGAMGWSTMGRSRGPDPSLRASPRPAANAPHTRGSTRWRR